METILTPAEIFLKSLEASRVASEEWRRRGYLVTPISGADIGRRTDHWESSPAPLPDLPEPDDTGVRALTPEPQKHEAYD
jgi:hypothetical protein